MTMQSSVLAALTTKAAVGGTAVALAVGGAATTATGTPNPVSWGQSVVQAVQSCKDDVRAEGGSANGFRNVGQCVSKFARQHGQEQRSEHSQSEAAGEASHGKSDERGKKDTEKGVTGTPGADRIPTDLPTNALENSSGRGPGDHGQRGKPQVSPSPR